MADAVGLDKVYSPGDVEKAIYALWRDRDCFAATPDDRPRSERFCIVIPPPNVTGALHLGHALNNTLQDILVRWHRMMGHNTLWLPGTDHAGIATQAVVEKRLKANENKNRHDLGREELVKRIWAWKDQYEKRILSQLQLIGSSCDWSRTRFTLDDGLARAVRHTFFKLFRDGLIFRGKRLVNWDTQLQTAVADDEVYHETVKGSFWHFRYPVNDPQPGEETHVEIATTRPETMLGDTAVAVHPDPVRALEKSEAELRERIAKAPAREKPAALQKQPENLGARRERQHPA
ncbi:MAG: class I tRNA ligase family protein [Phycisphaerales bacterium]|nr:class I tRNA ligase family protein [Phycisphaerales bacterium]